METISERRRRKLIALAQANGGLPRLATACGLSQAALDQVIKGTLMPAKKDGTRSAKALGDSSARQIEDALRLGRGWFDADDAAAPTLRAVAPSNEFADALKVLARAFSSVDRSKQVALAHTFSLLVTHPEEVENVLDTVLKLLPDSRRTGEGRDDQPRGPIEVPQPSGGFGNSGQRDRVSENNKRGSAK